MSKTDYLVSLAGRVQETVVQLALKTAGQGGDFTKAVLTLPGVEGGPACDRIAEILASLSQGKSGFIAPRRGRIERLEVLVDESEDWEKAVRAVSGGKQTADGGGLHAITHLGTDEFNSGTFGPSIVTRPERKVVFLVNFGEPIHASVAAYWARQQKLYPTSPRSCLAIGAQYPQVRQKLGSKSYVIVTTCRSGMVGSGRLFPSVVWGMRNTEWPEATTTWLNTEPIKPETWFAFRYVSHEI